MQEWTGSWDEDGTQTLTVDNIQARGTHDGNGLAPGVFPWDGESTRLGKGRSLTLPPLAFPLENAVAAIANVS